MNGDDKPDLIQFDKNGTVEVALKDRFTCDLSARAVWRMARGAPSRRIISIRCWRMSLM